MGKGTEDVLKALRRVESASDEMKHKCGQKIDEMGNSLLFQIRVFRWLLIVGFTAFISMLTFKECPKTKVQHGFVRIK